MRAELAQQLQQIEAVAQQLVKMMNDLAMTSLTLENATAEEKLALLLICQQRAPAMHLLSDIGAINQAAGNSITN